MVREFVVDKWQGHQIIIYGAGVNGMHIADGLLQSGIDKFCFCDKQRAGEVLLDKRIISQQQLFDFPVMDIILGTGKYCDEVYNFLQGQGISDKQIFTAIALEKLGNHKNDLGGQDYEGSLRKFFASLAGDIYLPSVDLVITECCTLRCRDCSNLMQYYGKPKNCDANLVMDSFQRLLDTVSFIGNVRILGGEPFVNQSLLIDILERYKDETKVGHFVIVTNGTILPRARCIAAMKKNSKVYVSFSNYGVLSTKLEGSVQALQQEGISYQIITDNEVWMDYGSLRHYEYGVRHYQSLYEDCTSRRYCNTLFAGKFYLCPRAAHGENLGAVPQTERDCVDFQDDSLLLHTRKKQLSVLLQRGEYILACEYCNWKQGKFVMKALQTDRLSNKEIQ